jgi:hypothetical protein
VLDRALQTKDVPHHPRFGRDPWASITTAHRRAHAARATINSAAAVGIPEHLYKNDGW